MSESIEQRLAEYQFTRDEAIDFASKRSWEALTPAERGLLQLRQDLLCMDFSAFHEGVTELLGRPVYTHEVAQPDRLRAEYLGLEAAPTFAEIIAKLPEHLRNNIILVTPGHDNA